MTHFSNRKSIPSCEPSIAPTKPRALGLSCHSLGLSCAHLLVAWADGAFALEVAGEIREIVDADCVSDGLDQCSGMWTVKHSSPRAYAPGSRPDPFDSPDPYDSRTTWPLPLLPISSPRYDPRFMLPFGVGFAFGAGFEFAVDFGAGFGAGFGFGVAAEDRVTMKKSICYIKRIYLCTQDKG